MRSGDKNQSLFLETWSRKSRLRSGTRMLAALFSSSEEILVSSDAGTDSESDLKEISVEDTEERCDLEKDSSGGSEGVGKENGDYEDDDSNMDVDYKLFLEHLRVDGKSYVFEMVSKGSYLLLKYEAEDEDCSGVIQSQGKRSQGDHSRKKKSISGEKKSKRGRLRPKTSGVVAREPLSVHLSEADWSLVDENYQVFLNNVRVCGDSMILQLGDNVVVRYEEEIGQGREEEDKEEGEGAEKELPYQTKDKTKETNLHSCNMELQPYTGCQLYGIQASYAERLADILKKPFDLNEYEELLEAATVRIPKFKLKHLRTMDKSYATDEPGLSYLDYYPELAKRIRYADYATGLNLLRGFFFWLKNLGHEGAFMPWVSPSLTYTATFDYGCSAVLPLQIEMPND